MKAKEIYRGKEIKFYDKFMALKEGLIKDYINYNPNFGSKTAGDDLSSYGTETTAVIFKNYVPSLLKYDITKMKSVNEGLVGRDQWEGNNRDNFPTAYKLFDEFLECSFANYGLLMPHSVICRHTGPENRDGKFIRIHIPLIIPEGDIGFEVACEEVDWSDIFAFNNQRVHSAWNNTNFSRLVFFFDLPRSICDMPPGIPYTPVLNRNTPRFLKGEMPERDRKKL